MGHGQKPTAASSADRGPFAVQAPTTALVLGRLSWRRALTVAAAVAGAFLLVPLAGLEGLVDRAVARGLEFRLRAALGAGPALDPHLKVFALDDQAVATLGATDLSLAGWSAVLKALAVRRPRLIMLDKTFAYPTSGSDQAAAFVASLANLGVPVVAKAHAEEGRLAPAAELPLQRFGFSLASLVKGTPGREPPRWLPETTYHLYGPAAAIAPAFSRIGHDQDGGGGLLAPLLNAGSTLMVPHWALFAAGEPAFRGGDLVIGNQVVPVDSDGRLTVDLVTAAACRARLVSLTGVIDAARRGEPAPGIEPGDTVVVLPEFYAGAVDVQKTALGRMPQAFVHLALINSAVRGVWLTSVPVTSLLILLLSLAGGSLAVIFDKRTFPLVCAAASATLAAVAVATFVAFGTALPWTLPVAAFLVTGLLCRGEAAKLAERREVLLRHDLHGILSPERLRSLGGVDLQHLEATEQVVTIMFIDIVGFSRAAEKQTPREAFSSLKSLIDHLRRTVHEFGGVVDRTMGDGMLCVFGYDFDGQGQSPHVPAEQAARCAAQIQRDNLRRMLKASKTNQAVFPLRIGINTTGVYLGNLGDTERTDLTVIGNGVNFAQRLEAACDRHMAMIGASTRDLLSDVEDVAPMLRKRHIRVKHATELTEAYELDPFYAEPQLLLDGDESYRQFIGIERHDVRNPVPYPGLIKVMTNYGDGEMINFSFDGFTIKLGDYYAKDVAINLRMDTADGSLGERLERAGLASLILEVRWARPSGDGYIHGCLIKNLNQEQREDVISALRDAIKRYVAAERRIG